MEEIIYMVRKHGVVKVNSRMEAVELKEAAAAAGYQFKIKKQGWGWLVFDMDI